jgi:predicted amidohydrolase YtcJ
MAGSGELLSIAKEIDSAGMQSIVHAIGDKAVSELLDICEEIIKQNSKRDRRFRIEHAQHIDEKDFERFKRDEIVASVQPIHLVYDSPIVKSKLHDNLVKRTHNYKNLLDIGVKLVFGTDFPIADINPWINIQTAVTRKTGNEYFMRENRISLNDSIKAYTSDAAYSTFSENKIGSLESGKYADFIILEDNIFEMDEDNIGNCKVWKTFFDGKEVYSC